MCVCVLQFSCDMFIFDDLGLLALAVCRISLLIVALESILVRQMF